MKTTSDVSTTSTAATASDVPAPDLGTSLTVSWATTLESAQNQSAILSGSANVAISASEGPSSILVSWSTALASSVVQSQIVGGTFTTFTTISPTSSGASISSSTSGPPKQDSSNSGGGVGGGVVAGIAIATAIIGALLATSVLIMWQKKRSKKTHREHGFASVTSGSRQSEKPGAKGGAFVSEQPDFDLDRLFPQPLDDATVKGKAQSLLGQIDSHVETFYGGTDIAASALQSGTGHPTDQMLSDPTSRLFMIKKIICETMFASIGLDCPSETSFLPCRFPSLTRQLKDPNVADHATALSWSRLRTSFAFLLRPDSNTEQTRLNQAISTVMDKLNQKLQPLEIPGSTATREQDLAAICRSTADLGSTLLAQPAVWQFQWTETSAGVDRAAAQGSRPHLVYFPALIRLTDNKARKLQSPNIVLRAKTMR